MKRSLLIAGLLLLGGCLSSEQEAIAIVEKSVKNSLLDPESARFHGTRFVRDAENTSESITSGRVCGTVTARNAFGGMTKPQRFVATAIFGKNLMDVSHLVFEGSGAEALAFERTYWKHCNSES